MKYFCNKCEKEILYLNELEKEELKKEGSFVCSDCINKEMKEEQKNTLKEKNKRGAKIPNIKTEVKGGIK